MTAPAPAPVRLFDSTVLSGNGYKARHMLHRLELPYELVELDLFGARETRTPDYLNKNPNGRIPLLELSDGSFLAESNAILCFLARGTPYLPDDRLSHARVMQWMFFEQYSHEPYLAVLRAWLNYDRRTPRSEAELEAKRQGSHAALQVLETQLSERRFLVGDGFTIADLALYPYTRLSPEAKLDLSPYPAVRAWLERIESQPGHLPLW